MKSYGNILDYDPILETCDNCGSNEPNIFDVGSIGRTQQDFQKKILFWKSKNQKNGGKRFAPHFGPISVKSYRNILDYDPILETCDNYGSNEPNIFDVGSIGRTQQDFQKKNFFGKS